MSQGLARARAQPPMDALLKVAGSNRLGALRGGLRAAPGTSWGSLAGDSLARRAGWVVGLCLVAAPVGDDQEVLVTPGHFAAGQGGQEGSDGCTQLLRRVEREGRVVAALGLGPEPLGRAGARVAEGLCGGHRESAGPPDGVPERVLAVQALLVLGEAGEVAAPDRARVLLWGAGVDE